MSLEAFASALPSVKHTAAQIAEMTGADEAFIVEKVGLKERYVLGPEETTVDLATVACKALIERNPDISGKVDLLVCVTQNPDRRIPHNSAGIVSALGLPASTAAFDVSLGCSGFVYAVPIVVGFLDRCGFKNAILVTSDCYSRVIAPEDRDTNCIFGDAATATWIKSDGGRSSIISFDCGTDGSGGDAIEIPAGGALKPFVSMLGSEAVETYTRDELKLYMRGRAVFNFVMTRVPTSIEACLAKAGLTPSDIDYFALHQGSTYMLDALARRVGIPAPKLLKNMSSYGNTVSSTIPMLLEDLDRKKQLNGRKVLISGFGVGLSWATAVVQF